MIKWFKIKLTDLLLVNLTNYFTVVKTGFILTKFLVYKSVNLSLFKIFKDVNVCLSVCSKNYKVEKKDKSTSIKKLTKSNYNYKSYSAK